MKITPKQVNDLHELLRLASALSTRFTRTFNEERDNSPLKEFYNEMGATSCMFKIRLEHELSKACKPELHH